MVLHNFGVQSIIIIIDFILSVNVLSALAPRENWNLEMSGILKIIK